MHEKFSSKGLVILGVSNESAGLIDKFAEQFKTAYPLVSAPKAGNLYGIKGYPTHILVSATGQVISTGRPTESMIEEALKSVVLFPVVPGKGGKLASLRKACAKADILGVAKALTRAEQDDKLPEQEMTTVKSVRENFNKICEMTMAEVKAMNGPDYLANLQRLEQIAKDFKGLPVEADAKSKVSEFKKDKKIKHEIAALKYLSTIREKYDASRPSSRKKLIKALEGLVSRYPGTAAAEKAQGQLSGG